MQDRALGPLHAARLSVAFVIIPEKVQKAVHRQMGEVMIERFALAMGLAPDGLVGEHDIAQVTARLVVQVIVGIFGRKGQYIGRRINPAPIPVEPSHRSIVGQNNGKLGSSC